MKLLSIIIVSLVLLLPASSPAMILVKIPGMGDPNLKLEGYVSGEWFVAGSFSFGVKRSMASSGEHGGTEDINIGVGELQECSISKATDHASTRLMQFAINGNSCGVAEIHFVEIPTAGPDAGKPVAYMKYKLDRCFVKSWSTSGDADDRPTEEVAFYYNKIAFAYLRTADGTAVTNSVASWDRVRKAPWTDHGLGRP